MFNLNTYLDWGMYPQDFFGFSLTGKILVRTDHKELVLVNIGEGVSKYVTLVRQDTDMEAVNFVGSLLSPSSIAGSLREE